ncbi:MAG: hypothetical protein ACR2JE_15650 [Acidobacteriaceae bacterium]
MQRWVWAGGVAIATCFCVFWLPFLFPPPYFAGVSAANVAGFNNKIAAVSAAAIAVMVGLAAWRMRWSPCGVAERTEAGEREPVPLDRWLVFGVTLLGGALIAFYARLAFIAHVPYPGDAAYFIGQMNAVADYHRKLYTEVEFPYGPLLLYIPIWLRAILSPLHVTLAGAYFSVLVMEQMAGVWLLAYTLGNLPIARKLKLVIFLVCTLQMVQLALGLNYTLFRFVMPFATFLFAVKRRRPGTVAALLAAGEALNLAISPEMGFAFGAGAVAYGVCRLVTEGRVWLTAVVAPLIGAAAFLLIVGTGYLRMLALFSQGAYNLIVEPLPYVLLFLIALVWLVPLMLAQFFRQHRPEAPVLAALFVISVALLPVAFGRADPGHVFFNGLGIYLLSMVAISSYRHAQQIAWTVAVAGVLVWTAFLGVMWFQYQARMVLHYDVLHYGSREMKDMAVRFTREISPTAAARYMSATFDDDQPIDMGKLHAIVGDAPVATPSGVTLVVEEQLKRSGQYRPSFYWYYVGVLDSSGETRRIHEFNQSRWALIPTGAREKLDETPAALGQMTGIRLPYRSKRPPYVAGERFYENLQANWQAVGQVDGYTVYRRR